MDSSSPSIGAPQIMKQGPLANLAARRAAGEIHADPVQERVVERLQAVYDQLVAASAHPAKPGLLARLRLRPAAPPPGGGRRPLHLGRGGGSAERPSRRRDRTASTSGDRSAAASRC